MGRSIARAKELLRREMSARRRAVGLEQAGAAGRAATARLLALEEIVEARRVALYAALPDELPTRPLFDALRARGRTVLLPRTLAGRRLEFAPVESWEELRPGRYGVLEPPPDAVAVPLGGSDRVLVPGVAFDARGYRLGRGGGYYDRTFGRAGADVPLLIGIGYEFQVVKTVPHQAGDRRVEAVVTDRAVRRVREGEASG